MPSRVCDRTPCDVMKSILKALTPRDGITAESVKIFSVARNGQYARLTLNYCPGCGGRIGPDIQEYVEGTNPTGG